MFRQDFLADFTALLEASEPFGFVRFNDGEHALIEQLPYQAASGWRMTNGVSWLSDELRDILVNPPDGVYLGIASPCCMAPAAAFYRKTVRTPLSRVTFASIFSHRNYGRIRQLYERFPEPVVVAPKNGDFVVPYDGVSEPWDVDGLVKKLLDVDRPIFVAAGPCANVIISRYWKQQEPERRQTILDVGAALDRRVHGEVTRAYNLKRRHMCSWHEWHPFAPQSSKKEKSAQMQATFERGQKKPATKRIELWRSDRKKRKAKTRVRTK